MSWATEQEAEDITGVVVTAPQLAAAQGVVELYCGRTIDVPLDQLRPADVHWLKRAVAHQAVWQAKQPGYDQQSLVNHVRQDGLEFDYNTDAAVMVGPLAIRAIKNLSWMGDRALSIARCVPAPAVDFTLETSDGLQPWMPL
jgi:hypothetical protein